MKKLIVVMAIGAMAACNNNSTDSDKTTVDSTTMVPDTTSKMNTDTTSKMMTDTSQKSADTVPNK
jgi:hypothetical protein